ncbi:rhamnosyltransferase WsaF family glycosyltransferase [Pseudomonas fluorescens]|uniref:rhamnosyltransferase WsaF family glycosyltransferase n=1 Tax=Pseudomonas fluorescens TaxID=294 RepID=UPI00259B8B07|nr:glycosyltransferase [Pseudomonas fluorescens]WJK08335.1 glycosyltransferase [Pseudomonas fluorescens]
MNAHLLAAQIKKSLNHIRQEGFSSFLNILSRRLKSSRSLFTKPDVMHAYRFLKFTPMVQKPDDALSNGEKTVNWYIPPIGKGSGGHLNLFRFMQHIGNMGFINRVVIVEDDGEQSVAKAKSTIRAWFEIDNVEVYYINADVPSAAVTIATSWQTAYAVKNVSATTHKCYFVQDYEPWFYPAGTEYALAEQTYRFGFHGFTAGSWLSALLNREFGMSCTALGFSYERALYKPYPKAVTTGNKRVFFYVRPPTARRAFDLGVLVLAELAQRMPAVTVVMAGWDVHHYTFPFDCEHAGLKNPDQLAELYSSCDVALVLSMTNLSLLPLEIMACGVPVVSNRAECTQWLLNDDIAMLAEPTVEGLADALEEILRSPERAEQIKANAFAFAASASWSAEGDKMGRRLMEILSES